MFRESLLVFSAVLLYIVNSKLRKLNFKLHWACKYYEIFKVYIISVATGCCFATYNIHFKQKLENQVQHVKMNGGIHEMILFNFMTEKYFKRNWSWNNNTSSSNPVFYLLTFSEEVFLFANKANLA